nr:MAG TPA: hypothetical protein [Bacteriophage sp.]
MSNRFSNILDSSKIYLKVNPSARALCRLI